MADLLDIAPSTSVRSLRIRGERIVVRGLNANDAASIVSRFPHIDKLFGGGINKDTVMLLIERFGAAVGPIIAAGCGHLGEEKYEQVASTKLVLEDQAELFEAIMRLTFPNGIGSFVEKLTRIAGAGEGAKIKIRLRKSPSASQPSSGADSRQIMQ
jgi:hypothetical protein